MKRAASLGLVLGIVAVIVGVVPAGAQDPGPREALAQGVADLQKNPADDALRERIIKLAAGMNPAPETPETAREHYVMGVTFVETAKDADSYGRAIAEYRAALSIAPWWADAYKKLAIAAKAAGRYDDGMWSLRMYLASQPADARDAQDEIYKLRALKQTAGAAPAPAAAAAPAGAPPVPAAAGVPAGAPASFDALLRTLDGVRYTRTVVSEGYRFVAVFDIRGNSLYSGMIYPPNHPDIRGYRKDDVLPPVVIRGRETSITFRNPATGETQTDTFTFSADGATLTQRVRYGDGEVREWTYRRER